MYWSIVRYLIVGSVGWLTAKGVLKPDSVTDAQISVLTNGGVFVVTVVGAVVWSWLEKKAKTLQIGVNITGDQTSTITLQPKVTSNPESTGAPETK